MSFAERLGEWHQDFPVPWIDNFHDARSIESARNKALNMFIKAPPRIVTRNRANGEPYQCINEFGYAAVWSPDFRKAGIRAFLVGRDCQYRAEYLAACETLGEEPRTAPYLVCVDPVPSLDRKPWSCECQGYCDSGERWCKHTLALAIWLARPHIITPKVGLLVWPERFTKI